MNHGTYMRQNNIDGYSDKNSSDKTHISVDTQWDNAGVNNPIMPIFEDNTGTNNANMPQSKHGSRPEMIWARSGQVRYRPQRLDIVGNYSVNVCVVSILSNMILNISPGRGNAVVA